MVSEKRLVIEKYVNECMKDKVRIEKSFNKLKNYLPLSVDKYTELTDSELETVDQYLYRFFKVQDILGNIVFRELLENYVDSTESFTFDDVLKHLEDMEIVDALIWKRLRSIRGMITKQFDVNTQEIVDTLNIIFAYKDELITVLNNIEKKI